MGKRGGGVETGFLALLIALHSLILGGEWLSCLVVTSLIVTVRSSAVLLS